MVEEEGDGYWGGWGETMAWPLFCRPTRRAEGELEAYLSRPDEVFCVYWLGVVCGCTAAEDMAR